MEGELNNQDLEKFSNAKIEDNLNSEKGNTSDKEQSDSEIKINPKRNFVLKEIFTTEETYIHRLGLLINQFYYPLKELKILEPKDLRVQFETIEKIYQFHLESQAKNLSSFPDHLNISDFFQSLIQNISIYTDYLINYEHVMQERGRLVTSNSAFSDFIQEKETSPEILQGIEALLILPVQRIPRYRLLLEQLIKYTPPQHPDYNQIELTLEEICKKAVLNNDQIAEVTENRNRIMSIMRQIDSRSRIDLLDDLKRRYVKDEPLDRQCRRGVKEFHFWLFSDKLLYGQKTPLGTYVLNRIIELSRCRVSLFDANLTDSYSFKLESPQKSFVVYCKTKDQRDTWVGEIQKQIDQDKSDGVLAPLWIPDAHASKCSRCETIFSLINRRHHCRNCGDIVCDACSSFRIMLKHVDQKKEVRVCVSCFESFNSGKRKSINELERVLDYVSDEDTPSKTEPIESNEDTLKINREEENNSGRTKLLNIFRWGSKKSFDDVGPVNEEEKYDQSSPSQNPPPKPPKPPKSLK